MRSPRHRRPENSGTLCGPQASQFHEASSWPGTLTGPQASRYREGSPPHARRPGAQSNNSCFSPPSTSSLPFQVAAIDSSTSTRCVSAFCFRCPLGWFTRFGRSVLYLLAPDDQRFLHCQHFKLRRRFHRSPLCPADGLLCFSARPLYYYFIFFSSTCFLKGIFSPLLNFFL